MVKAKHINLDNGFVIEQHFIRHKNLMFIHTKIIPFFKWIHLVIMILVDFVAKTEEKTYCQIQLGGRGSLVEGSQPKFLRMRLKFSILILLELLLMFRTFDVPWFYLSRRCKSLVLRWVAHPWLWFLYYAHQPETETVFKISECLWT